MPLPYLFLHLLLCVSSWVVASRLARRPILAGAFVGALFLLAGFGLVLERRTDWAWSAMLLDWPDAVFFTDFTAEAMAGVCGLLWARAAKPGDRKRALVLGGAGLLAAGWSYAWYFRKAPDGLSGSVDPSGYCAQSTPDSCSAAAAVMLLHRHGIPADERETARLCLTREGLGTPSLGLYRGVALKTAHAPVRPRLEVVSPREPQRLRCPAVLSVGVDRFASQQVQRRMRQYGWEPGQKHAILVERVDPAGQWMDVADPSYGRERWPTEHLEHLWDGRALFLAPRGRGRL